jgi:hypothetical protein
VRVFVSGVDGSPNPDAGIGISRSIRAAFEACTIIAVDTDVRSSGLHWSGFDGTRLIGDADSLARLCRSLGPDDFFISSVDSQIRALARLALPAERVLTPPADCLDRIVKPAETLALQLGFAVPPTLDLKTGADQIIAFARAHGPFIWRKGYIRGAIRVSSRRLASKYAALSRSGRGRAGLAQAHVEGGLECYAFSAWRGRLLNAVWMRKEQVTDRGKTWSGHVLECPGSFLDVLREALAGLHWHGGGVLEVIRDRAGRAWLIDVNARFPAWVHGATLCGYNLVADLMSAATGSDAPPPIAVSDRFTRVVVEILRRESEPV